jgi:hypothetical protein
MDTEDRVQDLVGLFFAERLDRKLAMPVLPVPCRPRVARPVVDEKEHACAWQLVDEAIEQSLRFVVDPLKILEDEHQGLDSALPQKQSLHAIQQRRRRWAGSSRPQSASFAAASTSHKSAGSAARGWGPGREAFPPPSRERREKRRLAPGGNSS